jgi:hypothetical protein
VRRALCWAQLRQRGGQREESENVVRASRVLAMTGWCLQTALSRTPTGRACMMGVQKEAMTPSKLQVCTQRELSNVSGETILAPIPVPDSLLTSRRPA